MADSDTHPTDVHVGARIRVRRRILRLTQDQLAKSLGVSFQQVQKYERGANRVSASKLREIAAALGAPIAYFFEGLGDPDLDDADGVTQRLNQFLMTAEGLEFARVLPLVPASIRKELLAVAKAVADEPAGAEELQAV